MINLSPEHQSAIEWGGIRSQICSFSLCSPRKMWPRASYFTSFQLKMAHGKIRLAHKSIYVQIPTATFHVCYIFKIYAHTVIPRIHITQVRNMGEGVQRCSGFYSIHTSADISSPISRTIVQEKSGLRT